MSYLSSPHPAYPSKSSLRDEANRDARINRDIERADKLRAILATALAEAEALGEFEIAYPNSDWDYEDVVGALRTMAPLQGQALLRFLDGRA